MLRSLWTAASGMKTQQMYVDSISNNLANVNTVGFKKENMEFKSLLYATLREAGVDENGNGEPVSLQVGHGVRAVANVKSFTQGSLQQTGNPLDFAIDGEGFFVIQDINGEQIYTKDGSFKLSILEDTVRLTTADGYPVLNTDGEPIEFEGNFMPDKLVVDTMGQVGYMTDEGVEDLGMTMGIVQFRNAAGLDAIGGNYYKTTSASGEALFEVDDEELEQSKIMQRSLEASNVQVVDEMVKMIIAQRAYELSSKAIQTSDDMLGLANNLKR